MSETSLTNAEAARIIAKMARSVSLAQVHLAEGMWNPNFCAANCSAWALSLCEDIRAQLDRLERRATFPAASGQSGRVG